MLRPFLQWPKEVSAQYQQASSAPQHLVLHIHTHPLHAPRSVSCHRYRMSTDSVFTIAPAALKLGAVLSRGSPGITLYKADLLLGERTLQVQPLAQLVVHCHSCRPMQPPSEPLNGSFSGSSKEAVHNWSPTSS